MIGFFDQQARWAFILGVSVGAAPLYLVGRWSVFVAMSRTQVTASEMRVRRAERQRRRRMRVRRSDRKWLDAA